MERVKNNDMERFILENQNTLYHDYTFGLQQDYLIAPVMNGKIIYRALYGMPCPEFLQVSDHQLCFKSRWFVVIELAPLLIGKIVVGPVVVVVTQNCNFLAKLAHEAFHQGGFSAAGSAGNTDDQNVHGVFLHPLPLRAVFGLL